ncbi:MAG: sulfotransferase [Myxococcota bacterium]
MTLPTFFVIGAPKAGTTSLYEYLRQHPDVFMSAVKEPGFLRCPPDVVSGAKTATQRVHVRTRQEYEALFADAGGAQAIGEATPHYLASTHGLGNIAELVPNARIVVVLRDPAARAYSAHSANLALGHEHRDLEDVLAQDGLDVSLVRAGLYAQHLRPWFERFGKEQIGVFLFDDLKANRDVFLADVFRHIRVREDVAINTAKQHNASGAPKNRLLAQVLGRVRRSRARKWLKQSLPQVEDLGRRLGRSLSARNLSQTKKKLDSGTRAKLVAYFEDDIRALETLIDRDLSAWRQP